ncbi:helix-turn-helix domain-containing protein [Catenuloplanes japonicus]|uniref:helix-turn-helix domain-containing protein n=1 Tax=Catenuloplanes japonicus TaxID=33876 RepID=UPI0005260296|nr:helix-turn-helix transcriptional regulator [Catenuloplanes japonicus]
MLAEQTTPTTTNITGPDPLWRLVAEQREARGLSINKFAAMIGKLAPTHRSHEAGERRASIQDLRAALAAVGLQLSAIPKGWAATPTPNGSTTQVEWAAIFPNGVVRPQQDERAARDLAVLIPGVVAVSRSVHAGPWTADTQEVAA